MKLRRYQQASVDAVYDHLRHRNDNPVAVLPTGAGKSLVLAKIASDAVTRWSGRVLILDHLMHGFNIPVLKLIYERYMEGLKDCATTVSIRNWTTISSDSGDVVHVSRTLL